MGVNQYLKQELTRLQDENEALREEVQSLNRYLEAFQMVLDMADDLDPAAEVVPLLDQLLYNAQIVIGADAGTLLVVDEETGELVFVLSRGLAGADPSGWRVPPGKGIAGWVAYNRQATIIPNAQVDDRFYAGMEQAPQLRASSILAVPMIGGGRVLGVLEVLDKQDGLPFNTTDQLLLSLLCRLAGEFLHAMLQQEESGSTGSPEYVAPRQVPPADE